MRWRSGRRGIDIVVPAEANRRLVDEVYFGELVEGRFLPASRDAIAAVVARMEGIDAVVLGGTELPLLLRDVELGVPALDTTALHVEAVLRRMLGPR